MAKKVHLNIYQVRALKKDGLHCVSDHLYLKIRKAKSGVKSFRWMFRYTPDGSDEPITMKLGLVDLTAKEDEDGKSGLSLGQARAKAAEQRQLRSAGTDPVAARTKREKDKREKEADDKAKATTLKEAAVACIESREISDETKKDWRNTLKNHVYDKLGNRPVSAITEYEIAEVLLPIFETPAAAESVRLKLQIIFNFAMHKKRKWREASAGNPASWEALDGLIKKQKRVPKQRTSLHYKGIHEFLQLIRQEPETSMRALEFIIYTGLRLSEVLGAKWDEIDWDGERHDEGVPTWHVPGWRMKMKLDHRLPLSPTAVAILREQFKERRDGDGDYIFTGGRKVWRRNGVATRILKKPTGKPIASSLICEKLASLGFMGKLTNHGFRTTIRTWTEGYARYPHAVCEAILAHVKGNGDRTVGAYLNDFFEERIPAMYQWDNFINRPYVPPPHAQPWTPAVIEGGNVVPIHRAA